MTGFDVDPAALRTAADVAQQAADAVSVLELDRVAEIAAALPGARSGATAGELGPHWADAARRWAAGMESYATALSRTAQAYAGGDGTTAAGFDRMGGR